MTDATAPGGNGPATMSRRSLLLALCAPAVLVAVALLQLYLAHNHDLSPWKGGGFGMFAAVDRVEHRVVRATFEGVARQPIDVQAVAELSYPDKQLVDRALSMPTQAALARLAARMDDLTWVTTADGVLTPADDDEASTADVSSEQYPALSVSVWRLRYDGSSDVASPEQLRTHVEERS